MTTQGMRRGMTPLTSYRRPVELLRIAGLFIWFCAGLPLLVPGLIFREPLSLPLYLAWWGFQLAFGIAYWNLMRVRPDRSSLGRRLTHVGLLSFCALATSYVSTTGVGGVLLLPLAGVLPWMFRLRVAALWLFLLFLLFTPLVGRIPGVDAAEKALVISVLLGISLFVFIGSLAAVREQRARDELRKLNSELRATQALLAQNTRIAERVRIARELHDLVGHHLTALTLNLEVVTHLVDGKVLEHVQQAHSLAKLLLADVREVVSDMRQDDKVDLAEALRTLTQGVPMPAIHLDLPSDLVMVDPDRAQVLLRSAQEIITNSVRHAQAKNLWIRLSAAQDGLAMSARDDGRGTARVQSGNGLSGMSERLLSLGGKLEIESARGAGFTLHLWMPLEG